MTSSLVLTEPETAPGSGAAARVIAPRIQIEALHLFERIDLRPLVRSTEGWVASSPPTLRLSDGGYVVCFRYGVLVFVGGDEFARREFIATVEELGAQRRPAPVESEQLMLRLDKEEQTDRYANGELLLTDGSPARLQLVAEVLSRSVIMADYEATLRDASSWVERLSKDLSARGATKQTPRALLKRIGTALYIRQALVGRAEVNEKPDLLWEHPELERLFHQLMDEFEIEERNAALEAKLDLITDTARTALDLVRHAKSLRVEWYIVLLIVFDIVLNLIKTV
jgi:uncharacterized Rmd1/YagE family protein